MGIKDIHNTYMTPPLAPPLSPHGYVSTHNIFHLLGEGIDEREGLHGKPHPLLGLAEDSVLNSWHWGTSLHGWREGRREGGRERGREGRLEYQTYALGKLCCVVCLSVTCACLVFLSISWMIKVMYISIAFLNKQSLP